MKKPQLWIFIVPTNDQTAPLVKLPNSDRVKLISDVSESFEGDTQHLHIVDFSEPKEGDYITDGHRVYPNTVQLDGYIGLYRIVASTDEKLGVEVINQEYVVDFIRRNPTLRNAACESTPNGSKYYSVDEKQFEQIQAIGKPKHQSKLWIWLRIILMWIPAIGILWSLIEAVMYYVCNENKFNYWRKTNFGIQLINAMWLGITAIWIELMILSYLYHLNILKP